jgi:UDP-N-acetylmuramoylalanine--D-glutamate ligase
VGLLKKIEGRIGIWGYGVVGKAVARFLAAHKKPIAIFDTDGTKLSDNYISGTDIVKFGGTDRLPAFFKACSYIVPSPGIDLRPYAAYNNKYIAELDLFQSYWHKPIIGVTGSVGKTSITTILGHLLNQNGIKTAVGGNIGIGSLDLIAQQETVSGALLELSSFQLEHVREFRPNIAIISNLSANHLDRHGTLDDYWQAKAQIARHQQATDLLIIDWELRSRVETLNHPGSIWYIGGAPLNDRNMLLPHEAYWYASDTTIEFVRKSDYQTWQKPESLFLATFPQNALITFATLMRLCNNNALQLDFNCDGLSLPHRREKVAEFNKITFINDSKATSTIAMLAAVNHYAPTPTLLLMGGLSKGVDRSGIFAQLPNSVIEVVCFGKEAELLCAAAKSSQKNASAHKTLDAALAHATAIAQPNSLILLSPAGSSFDLYANYEERGNHFKKIVKALCAENDCR